MSHRTALVASIALTLMLALGIVAARDRLGAQSAPTAPDPTPYLPVATTPAGDGTARVIDVMLPTVVERSARERDENEGYAPDDDDDRYEHEEDEDEDDEDEDDD